MPFVKEMQILCISLFVQFVAYLTNAFYTMYICIWCIYKH